MQQGSGGGSAGRTCPITGKLAGGKNRNSDAGAEAAACFILSLTGTEQAPWEDPDDRPAVCCR